MLFQTTDIIQVLNEKLRDKRHIKVPQDKTVLPYTSQQQDKNKTGILIFSF